MPQNEFLSISRELALSKLKNYHLIFKWRLMSNAKIWFVKDNYLFQGTTNFFLRKHRNHIQLKFFYKFIKKCLKYYKYCIFNYLKWKHLFNIILKSNTKKHLHFYQLYLGFMWAWSHSIEKNFKLSN